MKKSFGAKTLVFPTPVWIICTYNQEGKPNAMTVAWGGVCSSQPPCIAISVRAATYTHGNILSHKAFTVNVPSASHVRAVDYCGIATGKKVDKFSVTGFTAVRSEKVDAPYIQEFPLILECKLLSKSEIGIHTHFIGEIVDVKAEESVLDENGLPDMLKVKPIIYGPEIRSYFGIGEYLGEGHSIGKDL